MKYDNGMAYYREDIIAALRRMLEDDTAITEKFSSNDGPPAPRSLRDYLKAFHSKTFDIPVSDKLQFTCTSNNFKIAFNDGRLLNSKGDKELTLTWSQVAKFIRDNWGEVFKKSEPHSEKENTSETVLPKVGDYVEEDMLGELLTFDELSKMEGQLAVDDRSTESRNWYLVVHIGRTVETDEGRRLTYYDKPKLTPNNTCNIGEWAFNVPGTHILGGKEVNRSQRFWRLKNIAEEDKPPENQITPAPETALQGAFDYSELDSDTAKNLRECETVIRQETAGYFTLLGAKFKEAQALLADHASGTFEKWYTAMGFKRQTVYNLIQRYDFFASPTIGGREDTFEALPLTLSYEVSKPDAPAELVEKVLDGDITTNAEYIKLKAELERTREECRQLDANSAAKDKEYEQQLEEANKRAEKAEKRADSSHRDFLEQSNFATKMAEEKFKLEEQIKELESRPVDVAVQRDEGLLEELEQLREENERLKDDNVKSFLIRLTMDEYEELLKAVSKKSLLLDAIRHAKIIKL